jgi:hypothetical protein
MVRGRKIFDDIPELRIGEWQVGFASISRIYSGIGSIAKFRNEVC